MTDARPDLRLSLVVAGLGAVVFVVLAALLVPWHWLPGSHVEAVPARSVFTAAQVERGEEVSWMLRLPGWGNLLISLVVACWLGFTRAGSRLVGRLPGRWWLRSFLAVGLVLAIGELAQLPLAARAHHVAVDAGLSTQDWGGWFWDDAVSLGVAWVFTAIGVLALMALARRLPRTWPAWAAGSAAALAMLGSFVYPVVVEPLFNDFRPMPPGALRTQILDLAQDEDVHVDDVLVADASKRTTTLNAYVSGFGSTRRVVVYDTVLSSLSPAEVTSIVAHELGHAQHRDVLVGTCLAAAGSVLGVGLLGALLSRRRVLERSGVAGMGEAAAVPLVLALVAVGTFAASPVQNTISRAVEARADLTALRVTGDSDAFVAMQRQLAIRSLADPTPPRISQFWFGSHPTVLQRIGMARQVGAGR